jgi:membrane associated rhomboid family serine protease
MVRDKAVFKNKLRLTDTIAAVTVLAWLIATVAGQYPGIDHWAGFIPARFGGGFNMLHAVPVWLTPLSATLLHSGILHLFFNMIMLIFCGRQIEAVLGWRLLAVIYLSGAYASAALQWAVDVQSAEPMVGASGAISALIGVYALLFSQQVVPKIGRVPAHIIRAVWLGAAWIAFQWGSGLMMAGNGYNIAIAAHIGGFLAGLVMARPLLAWKYRHA